MSDARTVGLIGVGLLGTALAERLLQAGFVVRGFDVDERGRERLRSLGGQPVDSPGDVVSGIATGGGPAARVVLSLPDSRVVRDVLRSLAPSLPAGALVVDTTTGAPADAEARAAELAARGVGYVDATVVGSSEQARAGEATLLVGGAAAEIARAEDLLSAWSARRFVVGGSGAGARLKLIVNLVLGLNRATLAEALHLARACGLDLERTLEVLRATPAASRVIETKGEKMIRGEFSPQARLAQHHKDVELILALARDADATLPLSELHERLLRRAIELGCGELDNSSVIRAWTEPARETKSPETTSPPAARIAGNKRAAHIALIGDYDASFSPHRATEAALRHSAELLDLPVVSPWISTAELSVERLREFDGLWIAPGSPYRDMTRVLAAIRYARERDVPCFGTCGGFQHLIIEYARHVLGIADAQHAEYDPYASRLIVSRLACSLVGRELPLTLAAGSRLAECYGSRGAVEQYYCNFGLNAEYADRFGPSGLRVVGRDAEGEVRAMEITEHRFFVGTLFVPQARSSRDAPHPLVTAFLSAARGGGGRASGWA